MYEVIQSLSNIVAICTRDGVTCGESGLVGINLTTLVTVNRLCLRVQRIRSELALQSFCMERPLTALMIRFLKV